MGNTCKSLQPQFTQSTRSSTQKRTYIHEKESSLGSSDPSTRAVTHIKYREITDDYEVMPKPIGTGGFGNVYKVVHKVLGVQRAAKRLNRKLVYEQKSEFKQFDILRKLDHPNIIRIYEIYETRSWIYIVTELCSGGELFQRISKSKRFSEDSAVSIMQQILSAVNYCHLNDIIHRDLKPQNILFSNTSEESHIKLIDFGASLYSSKAPEVLKKQYNYKCDLWSCGIIVYIMLSGQPPFNGRTDREILSKVEKGEFMFKQRVWKFVSEEAKDLIRKLLEPEPAKRINASQALAHPWFYMYKQKDRKISIKDLGQAVQNLGVFYNTNQFQQGVVNYIYNFVLAEAELTKINQQFRLIDTNHDGKISREELFQAYAKTGVPKSVRQVDEIFREIDKDGSGFIDYKEFVERSMKQSILTSQEQLDRAFKLIDLDGNGKLSKEEMTTFLGGCMSEEIYHYLLGQMTQKQITKQEFKKLMKGAAKVI